MRVEVTDIMACLNSARRVTPARATDGHFLHGVGAVNNAMGGAGVAAPVSILGTFYLNPAGLIAFDGLRVDHDAGSLQATTA